MKKLLLLYCTFCLPHLGYCQWFSIDTISLSLNCGSIPIPIHFTFLDSSHAYWQWQRGYCSPHYREYFTIHKTQDSFETREWFKGYGGYESSGILKDVDFISRDTVYVSYDGDIYSTFEKTTDGGSTWTNLAIYPPKNLFFINGHLGYGFKNDSLYRFSNDSLIYVSKVTNFDIDYYQLYFFDSLNGIILLEPSQNSSVTDTVIRTTDGGMSWSQVSIPVGRMISSYIQMLNDSVAYLYADSGYVYKSTNAGFSWSKIIQNSSIGYVHFLSEQRAYSVSSDASLNYYYNVSVDSGNTWRTYLLNNGMPYVSITMINDNIGFMSRLIQIGTGYDSYFYEILKTNNNGGIDETGNSPSFSNKLVISPNPSAGNFLFYIPTELKDSNCVFSVYNSIGELVFNQNVKSAEDKIEVFLHDKPEGLYFAVLTDGNKYYREKIILYTLKRK